MKDISLSEEKIRLCLKSELRGISLHLHHTIPSTNLLARELVLAGATHGTTVLAEEQTAGRGRFARPFLSPEYSGLYFSVVLYASELDLSSPQLLTLRAAVAVCQAIEALTPLKPGIKWVNDILLDRRKVCGISCESISRGVIPWIIVGIGINITTQEEFFPDDLRRHVTSLYPREEPPFTRSQLTAEILGNLLTPAESLRGVALLEEYRRRLIMLGERITVLDGDLSYEATALDIDTEGCLIVRDDTGNLRTLISGEISTRIRENSQGLPV